MQNRPTTSITLSEQEKSILLKQFPDGVCAFDLEMTGLSPLFDKIIEIAAIKLEPNGNISFFHQLINPLITIPEHTIQYHNIQNEDVRDMPTLKKPLSDFVDFYQDLPLIAHNAIFDVSFIIKGIHEFNLKPSLSDIYDSCKFSRLIYKRKQVRPEDFRLSSLASFFGIQFSHHQALDDAIVSMKVFAQTLIEYKQADEIRPFKDSAYLFKLNSFKKAEDYFLPNKLAGIKELVQTKTEFYIRYKGSSTGDDYRKIKPISVMPMPRGLILYALCLNTEMNKYFQVSKIQKYKLENINS